MIARVIGVGALAAGIVALSVLGPWSSVLGGYSLALIWLGAVPLILSFVGNANHGTLDNASGVATVLEAAALVPFSAPVGVLITDAEELALAGARAWARSRPPAVALNCDSVDDDGPLTMMYTGSAPIEIVSLMRRAALAQGERLRAFRLIPGILTDHVPLAASGWQTVTLSRGTFRTLRRIHTSRDTLLFMRGTGITGAASVLARTATELS